MESTFSARPRSRPSPCLRPRAQAMPPVLSIDFGSAFTKVALRHEPDEPSKILDEPSLNLDTSRICIPTIAASVVRSGATRWAFGVDAAGLKTGNGIRVYRNWKP